MNRNAKVLQSIRDILRFYEYSGKDLRTCYGLSGTELDILNFLRNNSSYDTASDIVEIRRLPKANVSQAVESLIQKRFLRRTQDQTDRRRIHLALTERAEEMAPAMEAARKAFEARLFQGFTPQERAAYEEMNARIAKNAVEGMEDK